MASNLAEPGHEDGLDTKPLRESLSMVLRQLQPKPRRRQAAGEIAESDDEGAAAGDGGRGTEGDARGHGNERHSDKGDGVKEEGDDQGSSHASPEPPRRRASVSSSDGEYNPSDEEEAASPALSDRISIKAEPGTQPLAAASISHLRPRSPPFSPACVIPATPAHARHHSYSSPRKRSRSSSPSAIAELPSRPAKYARTKPLNHGYLALLNEDILSAADRFTPADRDPCTGEVAPEHALTASQLGLTVWSEAEKALLFEALARLGPAADPADIAARVQTKSAVEVAAYLALLRESAEELGSGIPPAEIPAAVELSQACCAALEEAADAVASRQETYEESIEKKRWGAQAWLVGQRNWRELEREMLARAETTAPEDGSTAVKDDPAQDGRFQATPSMNSLQLFRVGAWLRLSERVFMNSVIDDYNWAHVAGGSGVHNTPALRATALEDLYDLAVEMTRRLVAATIWVSESRVRARRMLYPNARWRVWKQDAEAAALSLGLKTNAREFWAKCARRLRLDVYDDDDDDDDDDDKDGEGWEGEEERGPMSYDEVERALGLEVEVRQESGDDEAMYASWSESDEKDTVDLDRSPAEDSDAGSVELGGASPYATEFEQEEEEEDAGPEPEEDEAEKAAIQREMTEALVHSALEFPESRRAKAALRKSIRAERAHEAHADRLDARASYAEEKRLWAMLGRAPPHELEKPPAVEGEPRVGTRRKVDDLLRAFARTPGDWRKTLEAVPSRWEMEYALAEEDKRGKEKDDEEGGGCGSR
ncbi:hypothetical protein VTJ83DRAFT_4819 [Remersonia thermophila]|uniref:Myb-like domain-containing protein n=1 Tax=Remersonia thermophila TaxID=72144 RepID=A0ABR4DD80_9PEZI